MTDATGTGWLDTRRRHRRLAYGALVAGILGFGLGVALEMPVVGLAVYWAGFLGFFAVRWWSSVTLFDERECALERQASYDALRLAGVVLVVLAPGSAVLEEAGYVDPPAALEGALLGYAALFAVFGIAYLARRHGKRLFEE